MADAATVGKFLVVCSDNFGGEYSQYMTDFITNFLITLTDEQVDRGLEKLVFSRKYKGLPTIAEIAEAVLGAELQELELAAAEAWLRIWRIPDIDGVPDRRALERVGQVDPAAREAFRLMTGESFHNITDRNESFARNEFMKLYKGLRQSPDRMGRLRLIAEGKLVMLPGT